MQVEVMIGGGAGLPGLPAYVRAIEALGADGVWAAELSDDAFFPLFLAAEHSDRLQLATSVVAAFARTPMTMAYEAAAIEALAPGRLTLGIGSQTQTHITSRFGMPWSAPIPRMRDFIGALRAIWRSWSEQRSPKYRGTHYTHTYMPPLFAPSLSPTSDLRVYLAGVGPKMTALAGELADGFMFHPFTSRAYLDQVSLPALAEGRGRRDDSSIHVAVAGPIMVATGTDEEIVNMTEVIRAQIAFYASTPPYVPMLAQHGLEQLNVDVRRLMARGRWDDLGSIVTDEVLSLFAIVAEPARLADDIRARFGGIVDRIAFALPESALEDVATWSGVIENIRTTPTYAASPR